MHYLLYGNLFVPIFSSVGNRSGSTGEPGGASAAVGRAGAAAGAAL
jgi:hypothetical protein